MSSTPLRFARFRSATGRSTPARISALTSDSSWPRSGWLNSSSRATRSMAGAKPRPDSTHTTSRSSASGRPLRRRLMRRCRTCSSTMSGRRTPMKAASTQQETDHVRRQCRQPARGDEHDERQRQRENELHAVEVAQRLRLAETGLDEARLRGIALGGRLRHDVARQRSDEPTEVERARRAALRQRDFRDPAPDRDPWRPLRATRCRTRTGKRRRRSRAAATRDRLRPRRIQPRCDRFHARFPTRRYG